MKKPVRLRIGHRFQYTHPEYEYIAVVVSIGSMTKNSHIDDDPYDDIAKTCPVHLTVVRQLWDHGDTRYPGKKLSEQYGILRDVLLGKKIKGKKGVWKYIPRSGPQPKSCRDCE